MCLLAFRFSKKTLGAEGVSGYKVYTLKPLIALKKIIQMISTVSGCMVSTGMKKVKLARKPHLLLSLN